MLLFEPLFDFFSFQPRSRTRTATQYNPTTKMTLTRHGECPSPAGSQLLRRHSSAHCPQSLSAPVPVHPSNHRQHHGAHVMQTMHIHDGCGQADTDSGNNIAPTHQHAHALISHYTWTSKDPTRDTVHMQHSHANPRNPMPHTTQPRAMQTHRTICDDGDTGTNDLYADSHADEQQTRRLARQPRRRTTYVPTRETTTQTKDLRANSRDNHANEGLTRRPARQPHRRTTPAPTRETATQTNDNTPHARETTTLNPPHRPAHLCNAVHVPPSASPSRTPGCYLTRPNAPTIAMCRLTGTRCKRMAQRRRPTRPQH
jgi:hypothetical protein